MAIRRFLKRESACAAFAAIGLAIPTRRLAISARAYHRTLKLARTIDDLDGAGGVKRIHIAEALSLKRQWAGAAERWRVSERKSLSFLNALGA